MPSVSAARSAIVAEGVRLHEERSGRPIDEAHAWKQAASAGEGLEARVRARALATRLGGQLLEALARLDRVLRVLVLLAVALALVSGAAACALVFGAAAGGIEGQLNVFWAVTSLLGLQTLMLIVWLVLLLLPGPGGGGVLGQAVLHTAGALARWLQRDEVHPLAVRAAGAWLARSGAARWAAGLLTHLLWAAFGVGAVLAAVWILSVRQFDFVWGTTLLGEEVFVRLVSWLGALPAALGMGVPDAALVSASRIGTELAPEARRAWSTLLLACLVFYGLVPRLGLAVVCRLQLAWRLRRARLDLNAPGYARLAARLLPASVSLGVVDPAPGQTPAAPRAVPRAVAPGSPVLLVWLALPPERCERLAQLADGRVEVFGAADAREARATLLASLPTRRPAPGLVAVVTSLLRTPDRHAVNLLSALRAASGAALWLVLTETEQVAAHGVDLPTRVAAWREAAEAAPVERMLVETADGARRDRLEALFAALDEAGGIP